MVNKIENKSTKRVAIQRVAVIGCGAWGLAIANLLFKNGLEVKVFSRQINRQINKKEKINQKIIISSNINLVVRDSQFIFVVVPSNSVLQVLESLSQAKISDKTKIIICSKGIVLDEQNSTDKKLKLFHICVEEILPKNQYAILSGPNFAKEVSKSLPTITTIASKDKKTAFETANLLKNNNFLPIISNDIISAQIFGAVKNILAIGCGMIDGLKLGENAKAALILKGASEACLLSKNLGGKPNQNFIFPAGLGDLFLTCSSKKSRNNSFGFLIGKGGKIEEILKSQITFEGFNAAKLMVDFANQNKIFLPLCEKINQILQNNFSKKEIKQIISTIILN